MTNRRNGDDAKATTPIRCARCGSSDVETAWIADDFRYGEGSDAVTLRSHVPLRSCKQCGFEFLDHEAEDVRQQVVCDFLAQAQAAKQ